jgi:hypothetical protein
MREIYKKNLCLCGLRFIAQPTRVKDTLVHAIAEDRNLDTSFNESNFS